MQEKGVQDVVHRNKIKFESNDDLVDQAFFVNLMRTQLTIKIHTAKFKMMEHQVQNVPMKMIQNTQK